MLKPLYGIHAGLKQDLRTFFQQDFPSFQLVFGVRDSSDPALKIVAELQAEFPRCDVAIVIDSTRHGENRKVENLINMMKAVRHQYLVIADADIRVRPDYLEALMSELTVADVGIVTCLYRGVPASGLWSRVGALFIDDWFAVTVRIAHLFGSRAFAFGATIAMKRTTLNAIGGFASVANRLADDYWLGALTRKLGLKTVLSSYVVETSIGESSLVQLVEHEKRWMRTIRSVQPLGHATLFASFAMPLAALGALCLGGTLPWWGVAIVFSARAMRLIPERRTLGEVATDLLLLPLRDLLMLWVWLASFGNAPIRWGDDYFLVADDGKFVSSAPPLTLRPAEQVDR